MFSAQVWVLLFTAVSVACVHTLTGPDHYLPFIALAKTRKWSLQKTIFWVLACGSAHVGSSVLLGLGGAAIGWNMQQLSWIENVRGGLAAWALLLFGVLYTLWAIYQLGKQRQHKHFDVADNGQVYVFEHQHGIVVAPNNRYRVTPWVMFIIFLLGPCEPMIPLLFYPAAQHATLHMLLLVVVYTACTLVTMLTMVLLGYYGIAFLKTAFLEKYLHLLGGISLILCGVGMVFLGW